VSLLIQTHTGMVAGEHIPLLRATTALVSPSPSPTGPDPPRRARARAPPTTSQSSVPAAATKASISNVGYDTVRRLVRDVRPVEALAFVPLSFAEMALMKVTGTVAGSVYKSLVDLDAGLFFDTMRTAVLYYVLFACLSAAQEYVKYGLALAWRRRLTGLLHEAYFREGGRLRGVTRGVNGVDNCDQRMTSEVAGLCATLADIVSKVAASPFKVVFYGYVAGGYIGFTSLCVVIVFFVGSVCLQKVVAWPLARALVRLERAEGDFRASHMRVRKAGADIGLQGSRVAEARAVGGRLEAVLGVQGVVVVWRAAVMGVTRVVDYGGAMVNYAVVAMAIFWGGRGVDSGDSQDSQDSGDRAAFVSNASFFTLTLVYTLTEVVDLGPSVSAVVSLLSRVYGLLDALVGDAGAGEGVGGHGRAAQTQDVAASAEDGRSTSLHGARSLASRSPRGAYEVVMMPTVFERGGSARTTMEVAVVSLTGASMLDEVAGVFPAAPLSPSGAALYHDERRDKRRQPSTPRGRSVTCVMTLQARPGSDFDSMDSSLGAYLEWEAAMTSVLASVTSVTSSMSPTSPALWCDSVDPKTGRALRETRAASSAPSAPSAPSSACWSEVRAFHTFLKYPVDDTGVCPLVVHPIHGSQTYPVSFFTTASPEACIAALRSIGTLATNVPENGIGVGSDVVLSLENENIYAGDDTDDGGDGSDDDDRRQPLLTSINLVLQPNRHTLITGPNGAGKTTLLRHLCRRLQSSVEQRTAGGRAAATSGPASPGDNDYMFLPQLPLIGPGQFLWQQLAYPTDAKPSESDMLDALQRVGLGHLPAALPDGLSTKRDWSTYLSFGEQQRLCIARVCLRKPAFAFLDEAASGTDAASAARLIREVQRASTVVLVAHDVSGLEGMFPVRVDL
jgi:ABC-type uncharacterized transport system fused permease/ATPase subunit